jgi:hypothetical protein
MADHCLSRAFSIAGFNPKQYFTMFLQGVFEPARQIEPGALIAGATQP